ncbi:Mem_trans domain-containing protein [Cephalotus follicularis]|uniref:Mem_trans domain-containing protein n=1 Tax=Cephalotus follicularis TaxID=3775 RepID=A0A1Q3CZ37_CEPFO|nr:Mem_trans domain-containing protein [Cephalotus follicularis]
MGFLDLFVVALMPVLKVLLITALGLFLAIDRVDLLGPNARHHLNNLVFYVFSPALVVSNLAETITLDELVTLWFMPVNILLSFIVGTLLAWILIKITRTPKHLQGLVIGCCSAGNLGNLLLIIVPAVCEESNSPFGDSTTCSTYGEAYVSLSMAVGAIYIWTYVYTVMRAYANMGIEEDDTNVSTINITSGSHTEPLLPSTQDYSKQVDLPRTTLAKKHKVPILGNIVCCLKNFAGKIDMKKAFAPSTVAAIVGFLIGTVSPIRKAMIGDSAPLRVIYSCTSLLGDALIPSMTLIVGANLLRGLKKSGVGVSVIMGIIAVRYIFLPLLGIGIVKAAYHFGMVGSDSLYQFVLYLQYALPPAMNVGVITQLFGSGEGESSVIMLWTYVVAALSLTLWSTLYMWLLE